MVSTVYTKYFSVARVKNEMLYVMILCDLSRYINTGLSRVFVGIIGHTDRNGEPTLINPLTAGAANIRVLIFY